MSISGQNLTIVILTFKSQKVIDSCIESINQNIPIIVVENSNNQNFKDYLESKYKNLKCILSKANLGFGAGNNIGIKEAKTDYVLILNPDATLESNTLNELFLASEKIRDFSILSPICSDINFPNYGMFDDKKYTNNTKSPFKVDYVDGYGIILNKKKFKDNFYYDENMFLHLDSIDLCLRINKSGGNIYVVPLSKINHDGGKSVDSKYSEEIELSRNWHWIWSKFYFNKKHFGLFEAIREGFLRYISSIIKFIFYFLINNNIKKKIYFNRASGFYNALLGKNSWYRPNLPD